jgi:GTP:adenosylcobinamide-phosphate guanylyltransferase
MNKLSVIIPAAGPGKRMKSYGPKALIQLRDGETVISRQIRLIKQTYPNVDIVVVVGFEADKVCKELPKDVITVYNENYEETNVAYSINLGLTKVQNPASLIVYGDLVFKKQIGEEEVGVTIVDNYITRFSYGLPIKWAQIAYLIGRELELFNKHASVKNKEKFFGFEILNKILDSDGKLKAIETVNMKIAEIDTSKDINNAKRILE